MDIEIGRRFVAAYPPPGKILAVGITGSHYYGFPSPNSDLDLKGIHLCPTEGLLGLAEVQRGQPAVRNTHDITSVFEGVECDLTTHEVGKALMWLLGGNGNILERIMTPYQIQGTSELADLKELAQGSLSRRCWKHFRGFLKGMRNEHRKNAQPRAKTMLYAYRVALTGTHLLRTGEVVADLAVLAQEYGLHDLVQPLIDKKLESRAKVLLTEEENALHTGKLDMLEARLDEAREGSPLPEEAPNRAEVNEWLIDLRKRHL